jgi:hypothetical protein
VGVAFEARSASVSTQFSRSDCRWARGVELFSMPDKAEEARQTVALSVNSCFQTEGQG